MINYGKNVIDWIVSKPSEFNSNKIYVEGFSLNGYLANKLGAKLHQKIAGLFIPSGDSCFSEEKPMVRCTMVYKGDYMLKKTGGTKGRVASWNKMLIEGNDPRLFIFPGGNHDWVKNRWDWAVGCFGINPPCSASCEQSLFNCMDSSTATIGEVSGVKEGVKEFSKCMFSLEPPCSECAPTFEMLKRSEDPIPEFTKFNTFGAPIPPTEHKRPDNSTCVMENTWDVSTTS